MLRPEPGADPSSLADDAKHLCPGVELCELAGHRSRTRAIGGLRQNGADSLAERARRRGKRAMRLIGRNPSRRLDRTASEL